MCCCRHSDSITYSDVNLCKTSFPLRNASGLSAASSTNVPLRCYDTKLEGLRVLEKINGGIEEKDVIRQNYNVINLAILSDKKLILLF